jgi:hypothetical protein
MSFEFTGAFGLPGIQAALETVENVFWWGRFENNIYMPWVIDGATRDTGNTGYTDVLRPGLLLGEITATQKLTDWDHTALDGSQNIVGVLSYAQKMQRLGSNADRWLGWILVGGNVKGDKLIVPGQTNFGISGETEEHIARAQMHPRFTFSDRLRGNTFGGWANVMDYGADADDAYTVLESDNNTLFTNRSDSDAINFTLPTVAKKGLRYGFYAIADFAITVTAGTADTMVIFNDAAADSVALSTAGDIVGGMFEVIGDGTSWLVIPHNFADGVLVQTITVAT